MLDFTFSSCNEVGLELGSRLRAQRMQLDISQSDLAQRAGLAAATVCRLEREGKGTLETFLRVAQALGLIQEFESLFSGKPISIAQLESREKPKRQRVTRRLRK